MLKKFSFQTSQNIFSLISKTIEDLDNIKTKFKNNNH